MDIDNQPFPSEPKVSLWNRFNAWNERVGSSRPTVKNGVVFGLMILGLLAGSILVSYNTELRRKADDGGNRMTPVVKKILLLNFDPYIESMGNVRLSQALGWRSAQEVTNNVISDLTTDSGGYINYVVTGYLPFDEFPVKEDGFQYTDDTYLGCVNNPSTCHNPDGVDYLKILEKYQVCEQVNAGAYDELWLWGGPWFGYYESRLAGPGAFWYNSPPLIGTTCNKLLPIMGLNYERDEDAALHSYGHRFESTMVEVTGGWDNINPKSDWDKFTLLDSHPVNPSSCGNVHFPPNGTSDYDYGNQTSVVSNCDGWLAYPNPPGAGQTINCSAWGCSEGGYMNWWLGHMPKVDGFYGVTLSNWWKYVADFAAAKSEESNYKKEFKISSGGQDVNSGCNYNAGVNEIYVGTDGNCGGNTPYTAGLRFAGVSINKGAQIAAAYITLTADGPYTGPMTVKIGAEAAGNPAPFSANHQPSQLTLGSQINWALAGTWNYNERITSVDIKTVIQELVNRPDWVSGNSVNLVIAKVSGSNHRRFFAFERDQAEVAKLNIIIVPPPTPTPSPSPSPSIIPSPSPTPTSTPTPSTSPAPTPDLQGLCIKSGGLWKLFDSTCADTCGGLISDPFCKYENVYSCDCGDLTCWDGAACVDEPRTVPPEAEPSPTPSPTNNSKERN